MWPRFIRSLTGNAGIRESKADEINREREAQTIAKLEQFDFLQSATERLVRQLGEDIPR